MTVGIDNFTKVFGARRGRPIKRVPTTIGSRLDAFQRAIERSAGVAYIPDYIPSSQWAAELQTILTLTRVSAVKPRGRGYKLVVEGGPAEFEVTTRAGTRALYLLGYYRPVPSDVEDHVTYTWHSAPGD